jgi:hypothetical protein
MKLRTAFAALVLASASLASAEVHFGLVEDSDSNHYYRSSGFSAFEVSFEGDITLSGSGCGASLRPGWCA